MNEPACVEQRQQLQSSTACISGTGGSLRRQQQLSRAGAWQDGGAARQVKLLEVCEGSRAAAAASAPGGGRILGEGLGSFITIIRD